MSNKQEDSPTEKVTFSLYLFKEFVDALQDEADKEHRKVSHFASLLLVRALSQHTGRDMTYLIPYL